MNFKVPIPLNQRTLSRVVVLYTEAEAQVVGVLQSMHHYPDEVTADELNDTYAESGWFEATGHKEVFAYPKTIAVANEGVGKREILAEALGKDEVGDGGWAWLSSPYGTWLDLRLLVRGRLFGPVVVGLEQWRGKWVQIAGEQTILKLTSFELYREPTELETDWAQEIHAHLLRR